MAFTSSSLPGLICGFSASPGLGIESAGFFAVLAVVVVFPFASVFTVGSSAGTESVRRPVLLESSVEAAPTGDAPADAVELVELPAAGVALAGALCPLAGAVVCPVIWPVVEGFCVCAGADELPGAVEAGFVV